MYLYMYLCTLSPLDGNASLFVSMQFTCTFTIRNVQCAKFYFERIYFEETISHTSWKCYIEQSYHWYIITTLNSSKENRLYMVELKAGYSSNWPCSMELLRMMMCLSLTLAESVLRLFFKDSNNSTEGGNFERRYVGDHKIKELGRRTWMHLHGGGCPLSDVSGYCTIHERHQRNIHHTGHCII